MGVISVVILFILALIYVATQIPPELKRKNATVCIFAIIIVGSISLGILTNYFSNMVIPLLPHIISLSDSEESSHTNTFGRIDDEGIVATYVSYYNRVLNYHTVVINASTSTSTSEVTLT